MPRNFFLKKQTSKQEKKKKPQYQQNEVEAQNNARGYQKQTSASEAQHKV